MRYDKRITFVTEHAGGYDPDTGKHEEPRIEEDAKPCNLSALGITRTNELFGQIDKKIVVARLQRPYNKPFDHVLIKKGEYKGKYSVKRQSNYRRGVFYLESVK